MTDHHPARSPGHRLRYLLAATAVAAASVGLAACGSESSGDSSTSASATATTAAATTTAAPAADSGAAAVAKAKAFLAPYTTEPVTWKGPTEPVPVAKDKHIVFIDVAPQVPTLQTITKATQEVSKKLGWKLTHIDVQDQKLEPAVQQAINLHPDGILLNFDDPSTSAQAFKELAAAKIPTVVFGISSAKVNADNPGITHIVDVRYLLQGQLTAATAALLSGGNSTFGIVSIPGQSEVDTNNGIKQYFQEQGGGKVVGTISLDQANIFNPAKVGQAAVAFLQAHPDAKQAFVAFDGVAAEVIPALKQAGLSDVQIFSAQGDAYNINLIRTGGGQVADAVWPYSWATWAAYDDFNRIFAGKPLPADDGIPVREFYKDNLYTGTGYWDGDLDFRSKYLALWGLS